MANGASLITMASRCFCIACGQSKEEAETYCKACRAAFLEIATEVYIFCAPCDVPEIEIATAEKKRTVSNQYKRKRCPTSIVSCACCGQCLGATPATPYCSVCESAMSVIASPEAAMDSVPPPACGSTRRQLRFDAAVGGVTVDLCTPKKIASPRIQNQKENILIPDRDDGYIIDQSQSQESAAGSDCEETHVDQSQSQESTPGSDCGVTDVDQSQSQESSPGLDCEVTDVLTVEDVISQRFVEATQNGEIIDLLSQEEFESSELQPVISQQSAVRFV